MLVSLFFVYVYLVVYMCVQVCIVFGGVNVHTRLVSPSFTLCLVFEIVSLTEPGAHKLFWLASKPRDSSVPASPALDHVFM